MKLTGTAILALAALAGLGYLWLRYGNTLVTKTLNPASAENIVNEGVTAAVTEVTGRPETLGGWLYDLTHPSVNPPAAPPVENPDVITPYFGSP